MALAAGTKLGPYEVLGELGTGGMGEVYRARDTRLDRTVAIKILPEQVSSDLGRRARFEREARTISALSHPNICALFDIGEQGGIYYVVLEYLEGKTLADHLAKGPLPISELLKIGSDIALALETAHRNDIVHRDLKPANVMLSKTGTKLLDFGLAKVSAALASAATVDAATLSKSLTEEGVVVGTFRYMAPEQLEGKEIDSRTDIFALGAVLYEMCTGRSVFGGASRASLIAAIMSSQPAPISALQPLSPPVLDRVVQTCLAKDPDKDRNTSVTCRQMAIRSCISIPRMRSPPGCNGARDRQEGQGRGRRGAHCAGHRARRSRQAARDPAEIAGADPRESRRGSGDAVHRAIS
jgi:eukaryotic-like serine/threonine-protein kinase